MLALRDLQAAFRRALLEDDEGASDRLRHSMNGGHANERIAVYRNNVFASLTEALRETFPVVRRLVDERFFGYAAHEFVAAHPPARPSLAEYGGAFAGFLATFPPCRALVYLPDVARFEWLMNEAATAPEEEPLPSTALSGIALEDAALLVFRLHPAYRYLVSPWPVDRIWRANQPDAAGETIDLNSGGVHLEISRHGDTVVFRTVDEAEFTFRRALSERTCLGEALEEALAAAPDFSAADALAALFQEGAVVSITHGSSGKEHAS